MSRSCDKPNFFLRIIIINNMDNKVLEIFIPGPAGRLEAKYFKSKKSTSPIALVLQPHPQYGGTMNNRVVQLMYNIFLENHNLKNYSFVLGTESIKNYRIKDLLLKKNFFFVYWLRS